MKEDDQLIHLLKEIAKDNRLDFQQSTPLAGGDINEVLKISTTSGENFVVKLNDPHKFPGMFEAEREGLEILNSTGTFNIPEVIATGVVKNKAYLLLKYIKSTSSKNNFWEIFGYELAELHKNSNAHFGFRADNYIGTLPQQNGKCETAAEFYISQRLEPQFRRARERGYNLGDTSVLFRRCEELIPKEPPSLIHGDLWSGNYLTDSTGSPAIIDPAVSFAPREMDLAMMKLFGGFNEPVFQSYHNLFPLEENWEERIPLWQLYYLLVHLNIFGTGYKGRVISIIERYR